MSETLVDALAAHVAKAPGAPFLEDLRTGVAFSTGGLMEAALRLAGHLARAGVGPGDRVAYLTRNDPFFHPLLFACAARGAALVPIGAGGTVAEVETVLGDAEPALVFVDASAVERFAAMGSDGWTVATPALLEDGEAIEPLAVAADDAALIIYTSGTTGRPKGIVLTHANLLAMARNVSGFYGYRPGQRFLCCLPYHHINGPMITGLACLVAGAEVALTHPFGVEIARDYWRLVADHRIDVVSVTPSIMAMLLKVHPDGAPCDVSRLELALVGTAALDEDLWRRFEDTFGVGCVQGYGLTETTTWATMTPLGETKRYDTVGVPVGCEVRIEPATGEVQIKGPIVMKGYLGQPKLTRAQFDGDWFKTGDLGRIEADGQLVITGRIKNIVKRRGILVVPEEIDARLSRHPDVGEATTVGIKDKMMGERVVSAVVPAKGAAVSPIVLKRFVAETISAQHQPDEIVVMDRLPRTAIGKVDTPALRAVVSGETEDAVMACIATRKTARAPSADANAVSGAVRRAVRRGRPIVFVGHWGVGRKHRLGASDREALDRLAGIVEAVAAVPGKPAVEMVLILTDVHGRNNAIPSGRARAYFAEVERAAAERGIRTRYLSDIWAAHGLSFDAAVDRAGSPAFDDTWAAFDLREAFVAQAEKHSHDDAPAETVARRYLAITEAENEAIEAEYPEAVFFTYNGPDFAPVLPALPLAHWYSTRRGWSHKPWFVDDLTE